MAEDENPASANESSSPQIAAFKDTVIPKLAELGVTKLTVNYSGSGDEGAIEGVDVEPEAVLIPFELKEQISGLADAFLYAEHGSWGDNDGGVGTIVIDPVPRRTGRLRKLLRSAASSKTHSLRVCKPTWQNSCA